MTHLDDETRPRILFLTNRLPFPVRDGQSRRTFNVLRGLATRHMIHLLSLQEPSEEPTTGDLEILRKICETVELVEGPSKQLGPQMLVRLIRSLFSPLPYTRWRHFSGFYARRVDEAIAEFRIDTIHCDILPIAYVMEKPRSIRCALTDHDVSFLKCARIAKGTQNPFTKLFLWLETTKLRRYERKMLNRSDLKIVVSEVDKQRLKSIGVLDEVEVVENGVDTEHFRPTSVREEEGSLIWVGGAGEYANREGMEFFLRKVYPRVQEKVTDVSLTIVGSGFEQVRGSACLLDDSMRMTGYVEDPMEYIAKASVFIVPILSGSGTRLKLLEGMAAGKAVVTTMVGCEGIGGRHGVHYMVATTAEEFCRMTVACLRSEELRRRLGHHAREFVKGKYDWKRIWGRMNRLYLNLQKR